MRSLTIALFVMCLVAVASSQLALAQAIPGREAPPGKAWVKDNDGSEKLVDLKEHQELSIHCSNMNHDKGHLTGGRWEVCGTACCFHSDTPNGGYDGRKATP